MFDLFFSFYIYFIYIFKFNIENDKNFYVNILREYMGKYDFKEILKYLFNILLYFVFV